MNFLESDVTVSVLAMKGTAERNCEVSGPESVGATFYRIYYK